MNRIAGVIYDLDAKRKLSGDMLGQAVDRLSRNREFFKADMDRVRKRSPPPRDQAGRGRGQANRDRINAGRRRNQDKKAGDVFRRYLANVLPVIRLRWRGG